MTECKHIVGDIIEIDEKNLTITCKCGFIQKVDKKTIDTAKVFKSTIESLKEFSKALKEGKVSKEKQKEFVNKLEKMKG